MSSHDPTAPTLPGATATQAPIAWPVEGRYHDLGRIAAGGMGEVRRVRDDKLGRELAMKLLAWHLVHNAAALERFREEACLTARLAHPGVVAIIDTGTLSDGRLWYTMQLVEGISFASVIARHTDSSEDQWSLTRLMEVFRHICDVVSYAHARGVIHCDLKPANIMLGRYGEVRVMDWGIARWVRDAAATQQVLGTPRYMAPEQFDGYAYAASDVFALGVMLRALLLGRSASQSSSSLSLLAEAATVRCPGDRPDVTELAKQTAAWLQGEQRRAEAEQRLQEADELDPELVRLRERAAAMRSRSRRLLSEIPPGAAAEQKRAAWRIEDQAKQIERAIVVAETRWQERVLSALYLQPNLQAAHHRLAHYHARQLREAEFNHDTVAIARSETMLQIHRVAAGLPQVRHGTLTLASEPCGATVLAYRYEERDRRLEPTAPAELGRTPLDRVPLEPGSYLLELHAAQHHVTHLPVLIERNRHLDGSPPNQPGAPLLLPAAGAVPDGFAYLPPGWFVAGGDRSAGESLPRRRLFAKGLLAAVHLVTSAEYITFLNALVDEGRDSEALLHAPRLAPGAGAEGHDALALDRDTAGHFMLKPDENGIPWLPELPICLVSWHAALAYCRWRSMRDGRRYRLPNELEWERMARGADGRACAWGYHLEPTWARVLGATQEPPARAPVGAYPIDRSPFGLYDTTGNLREWCINRWTWDGPAVHDSVVQVDPASPEDEGLRSVRGGCWHTVPALARAACRFAAEPARRFGAVGFRLVSDYPPAADD